jgi:hypothetical protein
MDIVKELKEFKFNTAKLQSYKLELISLEHLKNSKQDNQENANEVIEGLSLRKSSNEIMSKNNVESKIEKIALNYSKEFNKQFTQKDTIKIRISSIKSIIFYLELKIEYIKKVVIGCLSPKEKFVIEQVFIEKMNWANVKYCYNEFYRESMEIESLRNIKKAALKKIDEIIKETESFMWSD